MTDKQMSEKKKEFFDLVDKYYHNSSKESCGEDWQLWQWIEKLVEEVEREQLNQIEELSEEMEGNFNNTMFTSGFQTALDEVYYRLSGGKFLDEVLEEKDKGTN